MLVLLPPEPHSSISPQFKVVNMGLKAAGGGNVSGATGVLPTKNGGTKLNFIGGRKIRATTDYITGGSGITTVHSKIEADAPFSAVRIWYNEKNNSGVAGTFAAIVAATETGALDTVANAYLPIYGGTTYNVLSSSSNQAGWRPVTFAGSANFVPTLAADSTHPTFTCSDWIPCKSIPRTDVAGGNPMIVLRAAQQTVGAVYTEAGNSLQTSYNAQRGIAPWYREYIAINVNGTTAGTDGISTLANIPGSVTPYATFELSFWVEFLYDTPARNVLIIGDSREASASNPYTTSWALTPLQGLSTQAKPIGVMNAAASGFNLTQFDSVYQSLLAKGMIPTDIVIPGFSQNGFQPNHAGAEYVSGQQLYMTLLAQNINANVWMTTDYGVNGYAGATEAARRECVAQTKLLATNGLVTLLDTDAIITDYSVPNQSSLLPAYNSGDGVHANAAGQVLMSALITNQWQ